MSWGNTHSYDDRYVLKQQVKALHKLAELPTYARGVDDDVVLDGNMPNVEELYIVID